MARPGYLPAGAMTPEQAALGEELARTRSGTLSGPYAFFLRNVRLARTANALGRHLLDASSLGRKRNEIAIIAAVRHWSANYAWLAHGAAARRNGVDEAVVAAVHAGETPAFDDDGDASVYAVAAELLRGKRLSDATYAKARAALGEAALVETVTIAGFYSMISFAANAFHPPLPGGVAPPFAERRPFPDLQVDAADAPRLGPAQSPEAAEVTRLVGGLGGPFGGWLHAPGVAPRAAALSLVLRGFVSLPRPLTELAALIAARRWEEAGMWRTHAQRAREAGLDGSAIAAVERGARPASEPEAAVCALADELFATLDVSDAAMDRAVAALGETEVVELVAALGYFTMAGLTVNALG